MQRLRFLLSADSLLTTNSDSSDKTGRVEFHPAFFCIFARMNIKALAKDTALYGLSSIVGRFLNYLLVPLYTYKISVESGGYGVVTNLYAYSALLMVLLTFGMETTFFRFTGRSEENPKAVLSTALRLVGSVAVVFLAVVLCFRGPISAALGYAQHPEYIVCFALICSQDAVQAILFSNLRRQGKALRFVFLKMLFIIVSICLNLFIFLVLPHFTGHESAVGMIFLANLFCTTLVSVLFVPDLKAAGFGFDPALARRMLSYSWPLLLLGLVGILNQVADKILFPLLVPGPEGQVQLGIYGACAKIAMILAMLTQAFRYAYEPIVFAGGKDKNDPGVLSEGMKYFIVFALLAFLAVVVYMPVLKYFVAPSYWEALGVVPVVMMAEIFMGVYFNLSFWYKLTDKTWWGAIISAVGAAAMIAVNVCLVPKIGYWACAWGGFAGYGVSMVLSYILGNKYMPIPYDLKKIGAFTLVAGVLYLLSLLPGMLSVQLPQWVSVLYGTLLLGAYALLVYKKCK